jgi:hypothetical protein
MLKPVEDKDSVAQAPFPAKWNHIADKKMRQI